MIEARPSQTALLVAKRRAAHQLFDAQPLVLDDPIAVPIIGAAAEHELRTSASTQRDRFTQTARAMMVVRSRFAEDALARAVHDGVSQYIVLGAGLDTFAYRNPFPALRVFEVDHPTTQAWKHELLAEARVGIPANVTYVAVDFERDTLTERLTIAGFDATAPTYVSWLGVTMYLSDDAIAATLRSIASISQVTLTLDYSVPTESLNWMERMIRAQIARRVARLGEPFRATFTPEAMHAALRHAGFNDIEDLDTAEMNARYLRDRTDGLRIGGRSLHVVRAGRTPTDGSR